MNLDHIAVDKGKYVLVRPTVFADVVPVLVDLAARPDDVATDTTEGFALRVPHLVYERFLTYMDLLDGQTSTPDDGNVEAPAPKKRGRPRKNPLPGEEG